MVKIPKKDRERFAISLHKRPSERQYSSYGSYTDDLPARDISLKAAKEFADTLANQLDELMDEREKHLQQISELKSTVSELKTNVEDIMSQNKLAKDENELLRRTLRETEEEANALRVEVENKTHELKHLNDHVEHCNLESDLLRKSRFESNTLLKKNKLECNRLKLEVTNSKNVSTIQQEEVALLSSNIDKANKEIQRLNKRLKHAEDSCISLQADNIRLEEEIASLKMVLQDKMQELDDTKQQLEFHRFPKTDRRTSSIYQLNAVERMTRRFVLESDSDTEYNPSPTRRKSSLRQNMFVMLKRASDIYTTDLTECKETLMSDQIEEDGEAGRRSSDVWHSAISVVDEDVDLPESGVQKPNKMDIRNVYAHLTAAAVKSKYPEIDVKNVDLIRMSENMPFWELYPYFTHIFEGLKEKKSSKERLTPKIGGWFSWLTSRDTE